MFVKWVISLAVLLAKVSALHLYMGGNDEAKCFYLDLSKDTLLAATHSAWELEKSTNNWVRDNSLIIEVTIDETSDKNHRVYHHKLNPFGNFQFIAQDGGEHKICYRALVDGWWAKNRVKLEVDYAVGESELLDSRNLAKTDKLAERVSDLNRKLVYFRREQSLMREREAAFRDQSEATNQRVAYMTVFQVIVLAVTCAWQVSHLRSFFTKQKLV